MSTAWLKFAKNADLSELASIGDSFVNLIYSLAVSKTIGKPVGKRASNHVLSQSLLKSGLREKAGRRLDKGAMADYVEAMIVQAWINGEIEMHECVSILSSHLVDPETGPYKLRESSIVAFTELLSEIVTRRVE
ncbi:MAG: ribonuclease III family protein [Candidatus Hydrothermarchaeales archaeon]